MFIKNRDSLAPNSSIESNVELDLRYLRENYHLGGAHYRIEQFRWKTWESWRSVLYHSLLVWGTAIVSAYFYIKLTLDYFDKENSSAHQFFPESSFTFWKYACAIGAGVSNACLATYCIEQLCSDIPEVFSPCFSSSTSSMENSARKKIESMRESIRAKMFDASGRMLVYILTLGSLVMFFMNMLRDNDKGFALALDIYSSLTNMAIFYVTFREFSSLTELFDILRYKGTPEYSTRKIARALAAMTLSQLELCEHRGIEECKIRQQLLIACTLSAEESETIRMLEALIPDQKVIDLGLQENISNLLSIAQSQNSSKKFKDFKDLQHKISLATLYTLDRSVTNSVEQRTTESTALLSASPREKTKLAIAFLFILSIANWAVFNYYRWMTCILSGLGYVTNSSSKFQQYLNEQVGGDRWPYWTAFIPGMISNIGLCWNSSAVTYTLATSVFLYTLNETLVILSAALNQTLLRPFNTKVKLHLPYYSRTLHKSLDYHFSFQKGTLPLPFGKSITLSIPWSWLGANLVILAASSLAWPSNLNVNEESVHSFLYETLKLSPSAFWDSINQQIILNAIPGTLLVNYYFGIQYLQKRAMDLHFFGQPKTLEQHQNRELRICFQRLREQLTLLGASSPQYFIEHIRRIPLYVIQQAISENYIALEDLDVLGFDVDAFRNLQVERQPTTLLWQATKTTLANSVAWCNTRFFGLHDSREQVLPHIESGLQSNDGWRRRDQSLN